MSRKAFGMQLFTLLRNLKKDWGHRNGLTCSVSAVHEAGLPRCAVKVET